LEQLLPAAALEILEGDDLVQVTAHVRDCADCARLLASYREVVATVAINLPEQPLQPARSAALRARLLGRAGREPAGSPPATQRRSGWRDRWVGWAVAAGLACILLIHHSIHRPIAYGWLAAGVLAIVVVALAVYIRIQGNRLRAMHRPGAGEQPEKDGGARR
jgi:hypothetical protein